MLRWVAERLSRPDAVELLVARERQGMAQLQDEANALRARQDELAVAFAEGTINASQLRSGTASLETQLKAIESNMFDANKSRIFEGVIGAADVRAALNGLSLDRRRAVVGMLLTLRILPGQPSRGALRTDLLPVQWLS